MRLDRAHRAGFVLSEFSKNHSRVLNIFSKNNISKRTTERRLGDMSPSGYLVEMMTFVFHLFGFLATLQSIFTLSGVNNRFCASDTVQQCVSWATCIECGRLWNHGRNLSSIEECRAVPYNLFKVYEGNVGCLNKVCEGVNVEDDRLVFDCASPQVMECMPVFLHDRSEGGSGYDCLKWCTSDQNMSCCMKGTDGTGIRRRSSGNKCCSCDCCDDDDEGGHGDDGDCDCDCGEDDGNSCDCGDDGDSCDCGGGDDDCGGGDDC